MIKTRTPARGSDSGLPQLTRRSLLRAIPAAALVPLASVRAASPSAASVRAGAPATSENPELLRLAAELPAIDRAHREAEPHVCGRVAPPAGHVAPAQQRVWEKTWEHGGRRYRYRRKNNLLAGEPSGHGRIRTKKTRASSHRSGAFQGVQRAAWEETWVRRKTIAKNRYKTIS
jgi:hypothetical protein